MGMYLALPGQTCKNLKPYGVTTRKKTHPNLEKNRETKVATPTEDKRILRNTSILKAFLVQIVPPKPKHEFLHIYPDTPLANAPRVLEHLLWTRSLFRVLLQAIVDKTLHRV